MSIGLMTSMYYFGLLVASFKSEGYIIRVGHIRAFSAFASTLAVVSLLHGLYIETTAWLSLRFIGGFATAGLFIVIESWLLVQGTINTRGQVLAVYMLTLYAAQALGQFLINLAPPETLTLFCVTAILCSLSVIPLANTRVGGPQIGEPASLSLKTLYQKTKSGLIGCFCAGLILASIYGLLPLFISKQTQDISDVALYMALTILGGMALQFPVGRLSDYIDRRIVLIIITGLMVLVSLFMTTAFHWYSMSLLMIFIFGGFAFTIYPVSISIACDVLEFEEIIAGTQGLLLAYSAGAMIGPFLSSIAMRYFGSTGLFLYFAIIGTFLTLFFTLRCFVHTNPASTEQFVPMPQTTPVTAVLDPRSDEPSEATVSSVMACEE